MQIASQLAGFTLGEADVLRAAMGKKKKEEMAKMRAKFIAGAVSRGVTETKATEIFDLMAFFAGYGFNKSHSAAYAVISYQTAYLKANYPLEYLAALLNNEAGNYDKVAAAVLDCHARDIEVLPPDVNSSEAGFTVQEGKIRYGLAVIKNVGAHAIELLLNERRRNGPFKSVLDLCVRADPREINKRVLESLIRSGATDGLGERGRLLASIDRVSDRAAQIISERESGQTNLFGMLPEADEMDNPAAGLVSAMPPMPDDERLRGEKELLGLYLSDHPLRRIEQELHLKVDTYANQVTPEMEDFEVRIGGVIKAVRPVVTKAGKAMAFVQLEDLTATIEVIVFPRVFEERRQLLLSDTVVIVRGKVDARAASGDDEERAEAAKVIADEILAFDDAGHESWVRNQVVHLDVPGDASPEQMGALELILGRCAEPAGPPSFEDVLARGQEFLAQLATLYQGMAREQADQQKKLEALRGAQQQWTGERARLIKDAERLRQEEDAVRADNAALKANQKSYESRLADLQQQAEQLEALHAHVTQQTTKLAAEWIARRDALAADNQRLTAEMAEVRGTLDLS